ncbi:MAG: hypothetical protein OXE98_01715 [Hyphomicrobiales bacterium]|nr:hypothetical protein [Hyphomicrobiales bacterium]
MTSTSQGTNFPTGWGAVSAGSETFTLTVVGDDDVVVGNGRAGIGWFRQASSKVSEGASSAIITVEIFGTDLTSFVPAPSDGLPLKLDIVDDSGNTTTSNLVAFDMDGSLNISGTFVISVGKTSHDVTVYIIDNDEDANPENQVVKFKLREGDNFPTEWGKVGSEFMLDGFELTVEDNDPPTSGAPPRLPNPIRPPIQETSPKPSDEFPKEAKANP